MHQNKKLKSLIELSSSVKIYVPSTINVNKQVDNQEQVDNTLSFLSTLFGGATGFNALGCWVSQTEGLVKEQVVVCQAYCNEKQLQGNIELVIDHCEELKGSMDQEAIALEINNKLYFV